MNELNKNVIATLFHDIARQIQELDEEDIADVIAGKVNLQIHVHDVKQSSKEKKEKISIDTFQQIASTLKNLTTREEGFNLLNEKVSTKNDLTEIAKFLDLSVKKYETIDQIRSKIIESTIGFRLRSAAIQGTVAEPAKSAI